MLHIKSENIIILFILLFYYSCKEKEKIDSFTTNEKSDYWSVEKLRNRAIQHLDSSKWDLNLFKQDIETYTKYSSIFKSYPLNKSPFPVAKYDYAVYSTPFTIHSEEIFIKGVQIGEYETLNSETEIEKLTLLILANNEEIKENTLVDSRNYPYLTAQGVFKVSNNEIDWVFSASPDGFSFLLVNMKLFDLRFGETIVIQPQENKSFFYKQINDSPKNYENFEAFKKSIINRIKRGNFHLSLPK